MIRRLRGLPLLWQTVMLLIASVAVYNGTAFTAIDTAMLIQAAILQKHR